MKKWTTIILAGGMFLLAAALGVAQETSSVKTSAVTQRAVFKVENLTCGACFSKINSALSPMDGFSGMGANLFRGMVAVDFVAPLTPETIKDAISAIGYPATLDGVEPLTEKETFAYMQSKRRGFGGGGGCCGGAQGGCGVQASGSAKDI
ncbi:MAG TPA: hypothetical protein DHV36_22740 [Desulfobacteraceae bacterium]|nr:hypothetical protein [Desulfobacteraceae bacterium]